MAACAVKAEAEAAQRAVGALKALLLPRGAAAVAANLMIIVPPPVPRARG